MTEDTADQATSSGNDAAEPGEAVPSLFVQALWGSDGPPEDAATAQAWRTTPIRAPVRLPPPPMMLSQADMQAVARGYVPMDMNDKWLAYMEDDRLYLHRSWTGNGIYEVVFAAKETNIGTSAFVPTSAVIESDPEHGRGDFDPDNINYQQEMDGLRDLILHVSGEPTPPLLPTITSRRPALEAVVGDVADEDVDAIVNSANKDLAPGKGVNGAVHRGAGPELMAHTIALGGCTVGEAKITQGFGLSADWIIHTVAPRWHDGTDGEPLLLGWCYQACLACADEVAAESVAFPALGAGARGFPPREAARIAVAAVRAASTLVRKVRFVCFDGPTLREFDSAIREHAEDA